MAFVVEDGTGLETSTSYVDVAFADDYFTTRGVTSWGAKTQAEKEVALILATEYADLRWGSKLQGRPLISAQALEFPRRSCYDRYGRLQEGVPADWKKAVCEYALKTFDGSLTPAAPTTAKEVKKKKTVVGPITTEVEYQGVAASTSFITYPVADGLAKQFTFSGGASNGGVIRG